MGSIQNTLLSNGSGWDSLLDLIYPSGSYYITRSGTSPAAYFGGTWERISEGTYIMSCGDTFGENIRGGNNYYQLHMSQVPRTFWNSSNTQGYTIQSYLGQGGYGASTVVGEPYGPTAIDNRPQFITAFVWRRIS